MKNIDQLNKNKMYNDPAKFSEKEWGTFYPIHDWWNKNIFKL